MARSITDSPHAHTHTHFHPHRTFICKFDVSKPWHNHSRNDGPSGPQALTLVQCHPPCCPLVHLSGNVRWWSRQCWNLRSMCSFQTLLWWFFIFFGLDSSPVLWVCCCEFVFCMECSMGFFLFNFMSCVVFCLNEIVVYWILAYSDWLRQSWTLGSASLNLTPHFLSQKWSLVL